MLVRAAILMKSTVIIIRDHPLHFTVWSKEPAIFFKPVLNSNSNIYKLIVMFKSAGVSGTHIVC